VPYYFQGAPWDVTDNPCVPFGEKNDANKCKDRQTKCLEFVDEKIGSLLEKFSESSILICGDHGDCWGEDGLWEHGIFHEKVFEVPLVIRLNSKSI
jgi:arylsulfatase A-like enzyme